MHKLGLLIMLVLLAITNLQGQTQRSAKDYFDSGVYRIEQGDPDGALNDLNKAIEINQSFVEAYYLRGTILVSKRDIDGALAHFNKVLALAPNAAGIEVVYNNRGVTRALKGIRMALSVIGIRLSLSIPSMQTRIMAALISGLLRMT